MNILNFGLGFLGKYLRPIETYAYSILGLIAANGSGVDSMSVSTSALAASFPAVIHLVKEIVDDVRAAAALLEADFASIKADVAPAVAEVQAAVAALKQTPGA